MTSKLEAPLKREGKVGADAYTLTITAAGLALVPKGRRKGFTLTWQDLLSGDAVLGTAPNALAAARLVAKAGTGERHVTSGEVQKRASAIGFC